MKCATHNHVHHLGSLLGPLDSALPVSPPASGPALKRVEDLARGFPGTIPCGMHCGEGTGSRHSFTAPRYKLITFNSFIKICFAHFRLVLLPSCPPPAPRSPVLHPAQPPPHPAPTCRRLSFCLRSAAAQGRALRRTGSAHCGALGVRKTEGELPGLMSPGGPSSTPQIINSAGPCPSILRLLYPAPKRVYSGCCSEVVVPAVGL